MIRSHFGYHEWNEPNGDFVLLRFLYAREWVSAKRPGLLFDLAIVFLVAVFPLLPNPALNSSLLRPDSLQRVGLAPKMEKRVSS